MSHHQLYNLRSFTLFFTLTVFSVCVFAQNADSLYIVRHYNKQEYRISMRDGIRLFTSVYTPKDTTQNYPLIITRTPYSVRPYGKDQYIGAPGKQRMTYFRDGYIVVYQDVRGRYMSEGTFENVRPYIVNKKSMKDIDETTDTYDTVDWLVKNIPHNDGRVGMSGISYPGFYTSMGTIDAHPAVMATSPQAPVSKWMGGDDFFHNGALLLPHAFDFYGAFGKPRPKPKSEPDQRFDHGTPDGYKFFLEMGPLPNADKKYFKGSVAFWDTLMNHGTWDRFWQERNILQHFKNIKPVVMTVGGWFDTENLFGALHTYQSIKANSSNTTNMLVMGPWSHGQWSQNDGRWLGAIDFGSQTATFYTDSIEAPFFNYYLKGKGKPNLAEAMMFQTGANRWHFLSAWPPENVTPKNIYFREKGKLSFDTPTSAGEVFDEYISDPAKPVPYTAEVRHWYNPAFMLEDQRFAARRPDVLVYQSEPLSEDISVAGPINVTFYVSTSGTDADWIVKVIDVFPGDTPDPNPNPTNTRLGGYQMLVRGDVMRGKFRNSLEKPEPFVPNKVTKVEFVLQDVFHQFKKGHRVMIQVQSTWFPMIDRNPQKFVDIYRANESDFQKAVQRVFHSSEYPSHLTLGVMP